QGLGRDGVPGPAVVGVDARGERRRPARVAAVAAPAGVGHRAAVGNGVDGVAGAGVVHDLPVTRRRGAVGVPALALVVPDELATGHPVVDVVDVGAERRDEARVRVARVRLVERVEAGRRDRVVDLGVTVGPAAVGGGGHGQVYVRVDRPVPVVGVDDVVGAVAAERRDHLLGARLEQADAVVLHAAPDVVAL